MFGLSESTDSTFDLRCPLAYARGSDFPLIGMKTPVVLSVAVVANSVGSVCLSKGMKTFRAPEAEGVAWLLQAAGQVLSNPWVIVGVFLLIVFLACYMAALSWADLRFVLPATAPGYILTAILARIFLQEEISPLRWAGTVLIVTGTWLVARTYAVPRAVRAEAEESAELSRGLIKPPVIAGPSSLRSSG